MYSILNLISQEVNSIQTHVAGINNDDIIDISDMNTVLFDIGISPKSFDLIDNNGSRVDMINPSSLGDDNQFLLVANGDVYFPNCLANNSYLLSK